MKIDTHTVSFQICNAFFRYFVERHHHSKIILSSLDFLVFQVGCLGNIETFVSV